MADYTGINAVGAVAVGGSAKDKTNADVLSTARARLSMAISAYSETREDELDDLRFYSGSPDNHFQWPADVLATRGASEYGRTTASRIAYGASPRGSIALERCARAHAWLAGRDYVAPQDIHAVALDVLRHRVLLGFEAEAEGASSDDVIAELLDQIPLP